MGSAITIQRGRGKGRDPWAIRQWLSGQTAIMPDGKPKTGLTMSDVGKLARVRHQISNDTIHGIRNHKNVLSVLENLGCPEHLLYGQPERSKAA